MSERFAVLDHNWPEPHRDLFLERDGTLLAWRLPPQFNLCQPIQADAIPDHRLPYLDYEGPVGGDRGSVQRWDAGGLVWLEVGDGMVRIQLDGRHFNGEYELKQLEGTQWTLILNDSPARDAVGMPLSRA